MLTEVYQDVKLGIRSVLWIYPENLIDYGKRLTKQFTLLYI